MGATIALNGEVLGTADDQFLRYVFSVGKLSRAGLARVRGVLTESTRPTRHGRVTHTHTLPHKRCNTRRVELRCSARESHVNHSVSLTPLDSLHGPLYRGTVEPVWSQCPALPVGI